MNTIKKDIVIIGAGPGGYSAAIYAAKQGLSVTVIDQDKAGGTCLNVGCIPTKALLHHTKLYDEIKNQEVIHYENISFDLSLAVEKKDEVVSTLVSGIEKLFEHYGVLFLKGKAAFETDCLVKVETMAGSLFIEGKNIIIATGSSVRALPVEGADLPEVLTSKELLSNKKIVESLVIIGGGIIGMEFAFMYAEMGVKVDVIEALPTILPMVDRDMILRLNRYVKQKNITLHLSSLVKKITKEEDGLKIHFDEKGKENSLTSSLVLSSIGRIPNITGLGLDLIQVDVTKKGITVNADYQTSKSHIYAIGDVNGEVMLAHAASHQAIYVIDHILGKNIHKNNWIPNVIFTSPQLASIGDNENMLKEKGIPYITKKIPFSVNGRALIEDQMTGCMKFLLTENKQILGVSIFGDGAEHLIANISIMVANELSFEQIKNTVFAHPTISEITHESVLGILHQAIHYID